MNELLELMRALRDPATGCPWDQQQTFATIAPYTVEEAYEVADAIEHRDWPELKRELGDLLFQVVFHAQMAEESGYFDFADVVQSIVKKMRDRHPHVFGNAEERAAGAPDWETMKKAERGNAGPGKSATLDGIALALPALTRGQKVQHRAAKVGFDWPDWHGAAEKVSEELDEVLTEVAGEARTSELEHEVGDLLFSCVNLARHLNVDPETALRKANARFSKRFAWVEVAATQRGIALAAANLTQLDALWDEAKAALNE